MIIDRGQIIENGGTSTMYPINAGGIYNDDGRLTFSGGSISNNSGSGIYAKGGLVIGTPEVSMNGGTISGNALNGIDAYEGKVEVLGGRIMDNGGSGICIGNSKPLRLENCTISGNTGTNVQHSQKSGGGGVYAYYFMNVFVGKGAVISGNKAPEGTDDKIGYGGGINIVDTCTLHIEDGAVISDNYAGRDGGGIFASVTQVYIHQGAVISGNSAKRNGGGIYGYSSGHCVLSADNGSKFYNNTAGSAGADIYLEKSCNWKAFQCEATAMDAEYHDSGRKIDGWYEDRSGKRYTPVYNGNPKSASDIRNIKTELAVVASYTVKDVRVQYEFIGEIPGGASTPDDDRIAIGAPYTPKKPSMTFTYYAFDGWYTDDKCTDKFADGTKLSVDTVLYGRWIRKYPVLYKFISGTEGMDIPEAVEDLAPADNLCYVNGTKIIALQPICRELHAGSGTWSFAGYDEEEKIVADEDVVFTGSWNFTKDPTPETEYCVKYNFVSRTEGRSLPKTVYDELPDISKGHKKGETVTPAAPKADTVRESSGTWSFVGYNRDSAVIEDRDVVFVGGWIYTADPEYTASYSFVSGTGEALPWELWLVLPVDVKSYRTGDTVKAIQPYWSTFSVSDGTWVFAGYDKESAVVGTENVKFTGTWNYAKDPNPEPVNPHDPGTHNRGSEALGYGTVITGWYKDTSDGTAAGTWYYYDENGRLVKGWHYDTEDGKWYYLSLTDGHMLTGWQLINGKWYMFNSVTGMQTWNYDGSRWSYNGSASRPYGSMYAGETTPDNFTVDNSGAWSGGSISLDSSM